MKMKNFHWLVLGCLLIGVTALVGNLRRGDVDIASQIAGHLAVVLERGPLPSPTPGR